MSGIVAFIPDYDAKHEMVLRAFVASVKGAECWPLKTALQATEIETAVIFGLAKKSYPKTWPKQAVLDKAQRVIVVESAFVGRGQYWRVGWYQGEGKPLDYRTDSVPIDRWAEFVRLRVAKTRPWDRQQDGPVLVCGQLQRDTNVQNTDHYEWCRRTVTLCQEFSRGPVWFRPHPREANPAVYGIDPKYWDTDLLKRSLQKARAVVTYNSNTGVDAVLAGRPTIAVAEDAFARPVASHSLDALRTGKLRCPSRVKWLASLAYSQWNLEEMESGLAWRHLIR